MDSQKKSTLFLFGLFMFIMLVGLFGVSQTTRWSEPLANNIYAIAGLFAFSGDWTQELYKTNQMNPFIEFARFAAPLTTALIFFYLIVVWFLLFCYLSVFLIAVQDYAIIY